ncbi:MAG: PAS domain-containing protein, partial [Chitinophagaceae bacterium]
MKDKSAGNSAGFTEGLPVPGRRQLQMLQQLLRSSPDVICSFNEEGYFLSASAAAVAVWGYLPEELAGTKAIDLVCEADKERTQQAAQHLMQGHSINNFENSYTCKDGSIKPILWSATWDAEEKIVYAIAKDARAIRQTELQQKRLNRAYVLAEIAWWELDIATQVYTCSDEIFEMYGIPIPPDNKVTLSDFLSLVHPDDVARLQQDLEQLCNDTYFHYEHRI